MKNFLIATLLFITGAISELKEWFEKQWDKFDNWQRLN